MHRLLLLTVALLLLPAPPLRAGERADLPEEVVARLVDLLGRQREATDDVETKRIETEIRKLLVETLDLDPERDPDAFQAGARPLLEEAERRLDAPTPAPPPAPIDPAKLAVTRTRLRQIQVAAQMHLAEQGSLPELTDLVRSGLVREDETRDGWGVEIRLEPDPDGMELEVISAGPDGKFETDDDVVLGNGR